jgi:ammonium transporter Rh
LVVQDKIVVEESVVSDVVVKIESVTFSIFAAVVQGLVIVLFATLKFKYSGHHDAVQYGYFRDVSIMIFFGFGFLMTFLRRYGISAIAYALVISALVVEISLVWECILAKETSSTWALTLENLMNGLFCAGAVMISFGAVLGKTTPSQLVIMAILESLLFWVNVRLSIVEIGAHDVGGGMTIHSFGAYFGLAVAVAFSGSDTHGHVDNRSSYTSDITSLAGTLLLWVLWPSFNAAVAGSEKGESLAVANTFISLCSSTLAFAVITRILSRATNSGRIRFDVVHLQNATLAGGVAMGVAADLVTRPYWAVIGGFVAGLVSCLGYTMLTPLLSKCGIQDICGVHNLHGMPGIISAVIGMIACEDAGKQAGALGVTMAIAIVGGILSGVTMRALGNWTGTDLRRGDLFNDNTFWGVANDYFVVVGEDGTMLVPGSAQEEPAAKVDDGLLEEKAQAQAESEEPSTVEGGESEAKQAVAGMADEENPKENLPNVDGTEDIELAL